MLMFCKALRQKMRPSETFRKFLFQKEQTFLFWNDKISVYFFMEFRWCKSWTKTLCDVKNVINSRNLAHGKKYVVWNYNDFKMITFSKNSVIMPRKLNFFDFSIQRKTDNNEVSIYGTLKEYPVTGFRSAYFVLSIFLS